MKKHALTIWTFELRKKLYVALVKRFGPMYAWPYRRHPGNAKVFEAFCEEMCDKLSIGLKRKIQSGGAVANQIAFVTTRQKRFKSYHYFWSYMQNWYAAIKAGFARPCDLPTNAAFDLSDEVMAQHYSPKAKKGKEVAWYAEPPGRVARLKAEKKSRIK